MNIFRSLLSKDDKYGWRKKRKPFLDLSEPDTRQRKRAAKRIMATTENVLERAAVRQERRLALKSRRRGRAEQPKKHFPGEPVVFPKRKHSRYVQVGRLFHV